MKIWTNMMKLSRFTYSELQLLHHTVLMMQYITFHSQGHKEVFELIHAKKLYSALLENLIPLLKVDTMVSNCLRVNLLQYSSGATCD